MQQQLKKDVFVILWLVFKGSMKRTEFCPFVHVWLFSALGLSHVLPYPFSFCVGFSLIALSLATSFCLSLLSLTLPDLITLMSTCA